MNPSPFDDIAPDGGRAYLDRIVPAVRRRVEERKRALPQSALAGMPAPAGRPSFVAAVAARGVSLIAEVKRASPSKGPIRPDLDVAELVRAYERAGVRAVSVLTEEDHFLGGLDDLRAAVAAGGLPVLRKDFIVDEYQVHEARVYGASAVLIIAALLSDQRLDELISVAEKAGLDVLLEVHDHRDLQRALRYPDVVVGINNRDLRTFEVSLETTVELVRSMPSDRLLVSESGIRTRTDVERLAAYGVDGVLVGEGLLREVDVEAAVEALLPSAQVGESRDGRS